MKSCFSRTDCKFPANCVVFVVGREKFFGFFRLFPARLDWLLLVPSAKRLQYLSQSVQRRSKCFPPHFNNCAVSSIVESKYVKKASDPLRLWVNHPTIALGWDILDFTLETFNSLTPFWPCLFHPSTVSAFISKMVADTPKSKKIFPVGFVNR